MKTDIFFLFFHLCGMLTEAQDLLMAMHLGIKSGGLSNLGHLHEMQATYSLYYYSSPMVTDIFNITDGWN